MTVATDPLQVLLDKGLSQEEETIARRYYSREERDSMDESDFAGPHQSFPIKTQQDVYNAAKLIGHADDPEAVKAAIKRIAKRKGFKLPDSWQEEKKSEERSMPTSTHTYDPLTRADNHEPMTGKHSHAHPAHGGQGDDATHEHEHSHDNDNNHDHEHAERTVGATTPKLSPLYVPILRYNDKEWTIEGQVTSDSLDYYGTIFDYDASKAAFQIWPGNIREQHDSKKAVGRAVEVIPDDATRTIFLRARISKGARDTWEKILDGTLTGFSVNADPRHVETRSITRNGKSVPVYHVRKWAEVSVVDAPGSPGCEFALVRADGLPADALGDLSEEEPKPEEQPLERAGARLSADSRSALHEMRDKAMALCGCEECCGMQSHDEPDGDEDMERKITGMIEHALNPVYMRLQGLAGALARSNAGPNTQTLETIIQGAITRALETNASSLTEVRAELSVVKEQVAETKEIARAIADTPMPGAPIMNAGTLPRPVEKRLAADPPEYVRPQRSGSAIADAMRQLSENGQLDTFDRQMQALSSGLYLQQQEKARR